MAYYVASTDEACLPPGQSWAFIDIGEDCYFVIGRDSEPVKLDPVVVTALYNKIMDQATRTPEQAAS